MGQSLSNKARAMGTEHQGTSTDLSGDHAALARALGVHRMSMNTATMHAYMKARKVTS